jgi:glycosyltransferase involved in cell wall biosynthesis
MHIVVICEGFCHSSIYLQPWRHVYEISKHIVAQGKRVTILSNYAERLPTFEKIEGIDVLHLQHLMRLPITKRKYLQIVLKMIKPDVIVWFGKPLSCISLARMRFANKPIVWMVESGVHSLGHIMSLSLREIFNRNHDLLNELLNSVFPHFIIRAVANSPIVKEVIVPSQQLKQWLLGLGVSPKKLTVITSGLRAYNQEQPAARLFPSLEDVRQKLGFQNSDFVLTYLGSPCTLRGPDTVIRSLPLLYRMTRRKIKLLLLSRGVLDNNPGHLKDEENYLQKIIAELKLGNKVKLISGVLSREELNQFMCMSDLIVLPFKLLQCEIPLSVYEAMSIGKVVVATRIRSLEEIVGVDRGILIESSEPHQLARAIEEIINGKRDMSALGRNAQKYASSLPKWPEVASEHDSIFERAMEKVGPR